MQIWVMGEAGGLMMFRLRLSLGRRFEAQAGGLRLKLRPQAS